MSKWGAFREQQLTLLNWVDEKDAEATGVKRQVNLAAELMIEDYVKKLKVRKINIFSILYTQKSTKQPWYNV